MEVDPDFIPGALDAWRSETRNVSSPRSYMRHRLCLFLIALGRQNKSEFIPLVIAEIDRNPERIHLILRAVTKKDPTKRASRGDWLKLGNDWKEWFKKEQIRGN